MAVMDFSIIIPVVNEAQKIAADVSAAVEFISAHFSSGEVIVVDDGSDDDTSLQAQIKSVPPNIHLVTIRYLPNRGKGYAVRTGMLKSRGEYVLFADSGGCVPFEDALRGLELLKNDECELAYGSRRLADSVIVRQHLKSRRLTSAMFRFLLKSWMQVPPHLTDTQCGFKMYRVAIARELYAEAIIDGFQFDIEIILRAVRRNYRILEFPVEWTADPDSRLRISKMPAAVLQELSRLKKELKKSA
jgi:dolichyl-phosphate beta-glucosyltransferase